MSEFWFQKGYRRVLLDMHIPDWDERFLSLYDPRQIVERYVRANLTSVMFYCQSHVGLCYWPTKSGKMHAGLKGRDVVGEMLGLLREKHLDACAYYSVVFNNWAFLEHPEWRMMPAVEKSEGAFMGSRYGVCCPNNPDYRSFAMEQIDELVGGYKFDGIFFDMTFWPHVCVCDHCRQKLRAEAGIEIPETVDWTSENWCTFQAARERWMNEFARDLTAKAREVSPGITVYHNFATALFNWTLGLSFSSSVHHDFLGADFYGDPLEQLMVSKLMLNLTENAPIEFMTSCCVDLGDHARLKRYDEMLTQAFASTLFSGAFLFIDAINPDGSTNPRIYERIGDIFSETARFEPYLGGTEVEDIAVYFSSESKMSFKETGLPITRAPMWGREYPHSSSVRGVCRMLQQAHLPFGVITRRDLPDLSRYKVVILPNVLRMDREECEALREYVRRGGKVFASRYTSLTESNGTRCDDFMLADVFGVSFEADDLPDVTYLKPADRIAEVIAPQTYVSHMYRGGPPEKAGWGTLRLAEQVAGNVLATLTLPYANEWGNVNEQNWSSIHSSPPWRDTQTPVIVENSFGSGRSIYSAADIECLESDSNEKLFMSLIRSLLEGPMSYSSEVHRSVWMNVFHQPEKHRFIVGFLNCQPQTPAVPIEKVPFSLACPEGRRFTKLTLLPEETALEFVASEDGRMSADAGCLRVFTLLAAEYE